MRFKTLFLLAAVAAPASAQTAVADAKGIWMTYHNYVRQSVIDVPEDKYSFKATPEVRSFGELFAHVAGAEAMFCAMALGEKAPAEDAVKATNRAGLLAALDASAKMCDRAYAMSDAAAKAKIDVFGAQQTKLYALIMNAGHDGEHYGNIVTYMRLNKMVPPSSRPSK
jgi:uncharacterized damage-inducible protein DinB